MSRPSGRVVWQILARGERRYVVSASMAPWRRSLDSIRSTEFELYRNRLVDLLCRQKGAAAPRLRAGECGMQAQGLEQRNGLFSGGEPLLRRGEGGDAAETAPLSGPRRP